MTQGAECSRFFDHGTVELLATDFVERQALMKLCMPNCLFQAVTPTLLGSGMVDGFQVMIPAAVWIPRLSEDRFHPQYVQQIPHLAERSNLAVQQRVDDLLRTFSDVASFAQSPGDLVPMLPLGVYVECSYRCGLDSMARVLEGVGATPSAGARELQWAMADVLAYALEDLRRLESARLR